MISATVNLYKNAYSGLTRRIWLLSAVMLINRCGTMVLAFMTLYCRHLGFSIKQGGVVVAIYGLGSVTGAFIGGKLSDRVGFYYMQFISLFTGGILFIVLGQMQQYYSICICTFILSMVNESFRPANATAIAFYSTAENRTQSFSLIRLAINLGWGIGSALGGLLASIDYHLLFWVDGFTNITAAILLLIMLPKVNLDQQQTSHSDYKIPGSSPSAYKDKTFLKFLFYQLIFATCFFQLFTTIPLFFRVNLQLSEFWIGVVMAMNGVVIALVEMVLVFKLEGRRPYLLLISYGTIFMGVAFMLLNLPVANGFMIAVTSMLVITVAEMLSMPFMNSFYIGRSTSLTRGQYAGMYTMTWSAAQVIGSSGGSLFAERFGFTSLWSSIFVVCLFAGAGFHFMQKDTLVVR